MHECEKTDHANVSYGYGHLLSELTYRSNITFSFFMAMATSFFLAAIAVMAISQITVVTKHLLRVLSLQPLSH